MTRHWKDVRAIHPMQPGNSVRLRACGIMRVMDCSAMMDGTIIVGVYSSWCFRIVIVWCNVRSALDVISVLG